VKFNIDILRSATTGQMYILTDRGWHKVRNLSDEIIAHAFGPGRPNSIATTSVRYPSGCYPITVLSIVLTYHDNAWRCWYYGEYINQTLGDASMIWHSESALECLLRELVTDFEFALITKILEN
jgi:hypothetical protein